MSYSNNHGVPTRNTAQETMLRALLFVAALLAPLCATAAGYDRQLPVLLRADRIDIEQKTGVSLYRGHVVFTQGTLKLTAAQARAVNRGNTLDTLTAEGTPVTFRHRLDGQEEFIEGKAGRAVYRAPAQLLDLYRDVTVQRGQDTFRGAVLHYDLGDRSLIAESDAGQRVYAALIPRPRAAVVDGVNAGTAGAGSPPKALSGDHP